MVVEPTGAAAGTVTRKVASPVWPGFRTPKYAVSLLPVVRFSAVGSAMAMLAAVSTMVLSLELLMKVIRMMPSSPADR